MLTRVSSTLPPETDEVMFRVLGAAIEVHRHLGPGFLESIYQRAMCVELGERGISYEKKKRIAVVYKGHQLHGQELDLIVESVVVVEVKAVSQLEEIHASQIVSYLKATGLRAGLLINFNKPVLKAGIRRIVL
ncbi:MAG: GxxExxY protein [Cyanobacteria bacterium]|nr:GxxExxY protein [Cyanobacteriota bacterium]